MPRCLGSVPLHSGSVADLRRYLQIPTSAGPAYTADGGRVVFISDVTGVHQAWSVPADGGWPTRVSGGTQRIQRVEASPADPAVAVVGRDTGGDERTQLHRVAPDGTVEQPLTADAATIHRFGAFVPDGAHLVYTANARDGVDFDLYERGLAGDGARRVARLAGSQQATHVTPDGAGAVVVHARSSMDGDLTLVDRSSGAVRVLAAGGRYRPGGWAGGGRFLFVAADRDRDHLGAWRLDLLDGAWERIGLGDADVEEVAVADGVGAVTVNDDGRSRLCWFDPATLAVGPTMGLPAGVASDLCLSPGATRLAFTFSGAQHPGAVWHAAVGGSDARPLTPAGAPGLDPAAFVEPAVAAAPSFDGLAVPVLVYRPAGVDRCPAVVSVHGGPESQERPVFKPIYQYLLARGIGVVAPNVRGSTGYGRRYASLDDRDRRPDAVADLDAVARWAGAEGFGPLAVMGASYGGFMTLSALAAHPERFAAGVSIVGMANLVTFLERTGAYRRSLREAEYGSLDTDRALLAALSPISRVDRITTPLFVVHGANDPRVPIGEAEQIVAALRERGRDVRYRRFEDEGHGITRLDNRVAAYTEVADFLVDHLTSRRVSRPR